MIVVHLWVNWVSSVTHGDKTMFIRIARKRVIVRVKFVDGSIQMVRYFSEGHH